MQRTVQLGMYIFGKWPKRYGKRSLDRQCPKIEDNIHPSLRECSPFTFKNSTEIYLSLHMNTENMVLKHGFLHFNCNPLYLNARV